MNKFFIGSITIAAFCVLTAGSVGSVMADASLIKEITTLNTDLAIQTKLTDPTVYEFEITYDGDGDATGVFINDTVPAEWNVTHINGEEIAEYNRFNDKNNPNAFSVGGGTDNVIVFRTGCDKRSDGEKAKTSSTKICWIPFDPRGPETLRVTVETRKSPSGEAKYAPTSCGLLELNNGAIAYVLPLTKQPVIHAQSDPRDPLVAVEDVNNSGGIDPTGGGDEDGDTLTVQMKF